METVECSQRIATSLARCWAVVSDFGSLLSWLPGNESGTLELHGEGVGMTRDLNLPTVGAVQHRLDALDHETHSLTYSLTQGRPLGMAAYSVTVSLTGDDDHCVLHWRGEFEPEAGANVAEMGKNLAGAYDNMANGLASLLQA